MRHPARRTGRRYVARVRIARRRVWLAIIAVTTLAGCDVPSFGAPDPASKEGHPAIGLWQGFMITAALVGLIVLGLIAFVVVRYRRRDDRMPDQRVYHVPIEVTYTLIPVLIVVVLFGFSVSTQDKLIHQVAQPDVVINVTGFQWGWRFEYPDLGVRVQGTGQVDQPVIDVPQGVTVRFVLKTVDVIHSFWVPEFLQKRDLIPGVDNEVDVTPDKLGSYQGKCAEYCGLDHWRMPFTLNVVTPADFDAWVASHKGSP